LETFHLLRRIIILAAIPAKPHFCADSQQGRSGTVTPNVARWTVSSGET
jgi:hypothetical protein